MCAVKKEQNNGLIVSILRNKCTRCRQGRIFLSKNPYDFRNMMKMPANCEVCGQPFEPEVGFYYGTGYVSYGLSIMICVASLIVWVLFIGISIGDNRFFWWMGVNTVLLLVLQPLLMRISRTIWLAFFVHYNPNWRTEAPGVAERANPQMKNDW